MEREETEEREGDKRDTGVGLGLSGDCCVAVEEDDGGWWCLLGL